MDLLVAPRRYILDTIMAEAAAVAAKQDVQRARFRTTAAMRAAIPTMAMRASTRQPPTGRNNSVARHR